MKATCLISRIELRSNENQPNLLKLVKTKN